jgi:hypothetical protein
LKWLSVLLLIGVFVANDGAYLLSGPYSVAATFYMLQGAWTALLSGLLLMLFCEAKPSLWKNLGIAAMSISLLEALEIPACRLFIVDISKVRGNLCDAWGFPISSVTLTLEVLILAWLVGSYWRE